MFRMSGYGICASALSLLIQLKSAWCQPMRGSLEQGGSVSTVSNTGGTGDGEADVFFGELHDNISNFLFEIRILNALHRIKHLRILIVDPI